MTVLAHETHAVDDICFNVSSVKSFLEYLIDNTERSTIKLVIEIIARIIHKDLANLYLEQFFNDVQKYFKSMNIYEAVKKWYTEGNETTQDDKGNQRNHFQDENDGNLYYSTVPTEFLAFYIEDAFKSLIECSNIESFISYLTEFFQQNINLKIKSDLREYVPNSI
jgi:hypothetical protein